LFRNGSAAEGIARLQEDGHVLLVPGGHRQAVESAAEMWEQRHAANAQRPDYRLTISAPTNADARAISAAIRERKRGLGRLGDDRLVVRATDQDGANFDLPLAVGDNVRLFAWTRATFEGGKPANIGSNGAVLTVVGIKPEADGGVTLRSQKGHVGFVRWDDLRSRENGRVMLSYGDAVTIDAVQGATSTEHINALPSGSQASNSFKNYPAQSRSREATWLVVSQGREQTEILGRRALGDERPITNEMIWKNVAANLSRQPVKELAVELLQRASTVFYGSVRHMAANLHPGEQRAAKGEAPVSPREKAAEAQVEREVAEAAAPVRHAVSQRRAETAARRQVRDAASRPKRSPQMTTPTEAMIAFGDEVRAAGLVVKGSPVMDGRTHYVPVVGNKRGRKSGKYVGYLDGRPAGFLKNYKTGEERTWTATASGRSMTAEERAADRARIDEMRMKREAERTNREAVVARRALDLWKRAKPAAADHPYLARKDIGAHGIRQDRAGRLLVPMEDAEGRLWGVQTIAPNGTKLFAKGGRKQGLHAVLGELRPGAPILIAEGFATAATLHRATGLTVIAAFDSGNLAAVARAYRARDPAMPMIFAADNDHHLPRREPPLPNVGRDKAMAAAAEVKGSVVLPRFDPADPGTDWNDLAARDGRAAVRAAIAVHLKEHGIAMQPESRDPNQLSPKQQDYAKERAALREAWFKPLSQAQRDAARQRPSAPQAVRQPEQPEAPQAAQEAARRAATARQARRPQLAPDSPSLGL
jgi:phage/plasmid primase-like uncharacterized protein